MRLDDCFRFYARNTKGLLVNAPYVDCSYKYAGGGMLSTVTDLVRFANAMLYSYQYQNPQSNGDVRQQGNCNVTPLSLSLSLSLSPLSNSIIHVCTHTLAHTHAHKHICTRTHMHTHMHIHMHTHTHTNMHTHKHAHTHTRTHTHICLSLIHI